MSNRGRWVNNKVMLNQLALARGETQEEFDYWVYCEGKREIGEEPLSFDNWTELNESTKED